MDAALEEERRKLAEMDARSAAYSTGEMRSHDPSFRESMISGAGRIGDYIGAPHMRSDTANIVNEFAPGISTAASFDDAKQAAQGGRYGAAAGNAALGLLDVVPGAGALAGAGIGLASKAGRDIMGNLAPGVMKYADEALGGLRQGDTALQQVDATVGDINNPDVMFEGVSPHDFTPEQWNRFGKQYGVENLGPESEDAWRQSLGTITSRSGKDYTIPGLGTEDPFTYYDLLHLKQQGINPNDIPPELHQAIHDRILTTMSPAGEVSPERLFNQFSLGQISPNQPLTPNELAVARAMAKGPEDLKKMGAMVPWRYDEDANLKGAADLIASKVDPKTGKTLGTTKRQDLSSKIANALGLGAGERGGLGARGTADYTRLAETAQRIEADPDFFRFRGAGESPGSEGLDVNDAENWARFVERISNQTPGLSSKTGSFTGVWQNPKQANISAVDRHMAGKFTAEMFPSPEEYGKFKETALGRYNKANPKKKDVTDYDKLPQTFRNEQMFGYLNSNPAMKYRGQPAKGSNSGLGAVNPRVPEHLQPDNARWVAEPESISLISDPYRRVLDANAKEANAAGQGIFGSQWMLWDRIRNRMEPHEIMFPGLEKLPRMSMDQMHRARGALSEAGYMSGTKEFDEAGNPLGLQAVRPMRSASEAGYFTHPATVAGGALLGTAGVYGMQADPGVDPDEEEWRRLREAQGGFY